MNFTAAYQTWTASYVQYGQMNILLAKTYNRVDGLAFVDYRSDRSWTPRIDPAMIGQFRLLDDKRLFYHL